MFTNPYFLEIHAHHHAETVAAEYRQAAGTDGVAVPTASLSAALVAARHGVGRSLIAAGVRLGAPRPLAPEPVAST